MKVSVGNGPYNGLYETHHGIATRQNVLECRCEKLILQLELQCSLIPLRLIILYPSI